MRNVVLVRGSDERGEDGEWYSLDVVVAIVVAVMQQEYAKLESDCIETSTTRLLPTAAEYEEKSSHVVWIVAFKKHHGGALK